MPPPAFALDLRRLQTIPGVGLIVAATVLALFSDVRRFADAKTRRELCRAGPRPPITPEAGRPVGDTTSGGWRCSLAEIVTGSNNQRRSDAFADGAR